MMTTELIQCRTAAPVAPISVEGEKPLPVDIQWMPPGEHTITPLVNGKAKELTVRVDAAAATRLNTQLQEMRARAAQAKGDLPFLDFNHDDAEAAGRVIELSWGGEDPITGGIRAKVDWTAPGEAALRGRAYRRFSPQFLLDEAGQIAGIGPNMGGLVNKAAFQTIAPIAAKSGGGHAPTNEPSMEEVKAQLAELTAKLAALTAAVSTIQAKQAEQKPENVVELQAKVAALQAANTEIVKARAAEVVARAVGEGRLAPQDTAMQERWTSLIVVDPKNAELLNAMPVNPALAGKIVQAKNGAQDHQVADPAEKFATEVKAKKAEKGCTGIAEALREVIAKNPEGHKAWLASNGKYPIS